MVWMIEAGQHTLVFDGVSFQTDDTVFHRLAKAGADFVEFMIGCVGWGVGMHDWLLGVLLVLLICKMESQNIQAVSQS